MTIRVKHIYGFPSSPNHTRPRGARDAPPRHDSKILTRIPHKYRDSRRYARQQNRRSQRDQTRPEDHREHPKIRRVSLMSNKWNAVASSTKARPATAPPEGVERQNAVPLMRQPGSTPGERRRGDLVVDGPSGGWWLKRPPKSPNRQSQKCKLAACSSKGETRNRTEDTTIFRGRRAGPGRGTKVPQIGRSQIERVALRYPWLPAVRLG